MEDLGKMTNDQILEKIDIMSKNYEQIKLEITALCNIAQDLETSHALYLAELSNRV